MSGNFGYEDTLNGIGEIVAARERNKKIIAYDENLLISEGKKKTVTTQVYERSIVLRDKAIEIYTRDGKIVCHACGFDFFKTYGEIGYGFIEIHHQRPVFQYEDTDFQKFLDDAVKELSPLCSNCHRMIHRKKGNPLTVVELKNFIMSNRGGV